MTIVAAKSDSEVENPIRKKDKSSFWDQINETETRLRFMGVGESWKDPSVIQVYRGSRFFGAVGLSYRIMDSATIDLESGFTRIDGNNGLSHLQLIPVTVGGTYLLGNERVEPFIGLGASFVKFTEELPAGTISGTKVGLDVRSGVRIATKYIQSSHYPSAVYGENPMSQQQLKQMDVEILFGQRIHHAFSVGKGFDLGAFRVGVGLQLRL